MRDRSGGKREEAVEGRGRGGEKRQEKFDKRVFEKV
jgi:hypothetical protein